MSAMPDGGSSAPRSRELEPRDGRSYPVEFTPRQSALADSLVMNLMQTISLLKEETETLSFQNQRLMRRLERYEKGGSVASSSPNSAKKTLSAILARRSKRSSGRHTNESVVADDGTLLTVRTAWANPNSDTLMRRNTVASSTSSDASSKAPNALARTVDFDTNAKSLYDLSRSAKNG